MGEALIDVCGLHGFVIVQATQEFVDAPGCVLPCPRAPAKGFNGAGLHAVRYDEHTDRRRGVREMAVDLWWLVSNIA